MNRAEYARKCAEYERRIAVLERNTKWGGWKGTGNKAMDGGLLVPCWKNDDRADFALYKRDVWPEVMHPLALDENNDVAIVEDESRLFLAFGRDSLGVSIGVPLDYDIIHIISRPFAKLKAALTYYQIVSIYKYDPLAYAPLIVVAYPILDPWTVPEPDAIGGLPLWCLQWANQPRTTFTDNIANGAVNGFINPSTNQVDNYLGYMHCCSAEARISEMVYQVTPNIDPITFYAEAASEGDCNDGLASFRDDAMHLRGGLISGGAWNSLYSSPPAFISPEGEDNCGAKSMFLRLTGIAPATIYGIGFYAMTLADLQIFRISGMLCSKSATFFLNAALPQVYQPTTVIRGMVAEALLESVAGNPPIDVAATDAYEARLLYQLEQAEMLNSSGAHAWSNKSMMGQNPSQQKILSLNLA